MNTRKSLKIYNVGYTFKVQTVFKTNKHNNVEYFDQIILIQTRKLKLINFQARVSITYVTIFTQGKEITRKEEIFVNLFLWKQYYVIKKNKKNKILDIERYSFQGKIIVLNKEIVRPQLFFTKKYLCINKIIWNL